MGLSERTLAEMRAGGEAVAKNAGTTLAPDWFKKVMTIQERMAVLKHWESKGYITFTKHIVYDDDPARVVKSVTRIVHVGDYTFTDEVAEANGAWPSELLIAEVTLAVDAGVWNKDKGA